MKLPHLPRLMLTYADFPQQDWAEWRRQEVDESRDDDGATIDTGYMNLMPCCIHCATWICVGCHQFRRVRASRAVSQYCPKCGGIKGFFVAIRHLKPHEALPKVPFRVPVMSEERESIVRYLEEAIGDPLKAREAADRVFSTACPAGDPCPATGCPACCPSYDPCGEKNCRNCNPQEGNMSHTDDQDRRTGLEAAEEAADELEEKEAAEEEAEEDARSRGLLPPRDKMHVWEGVDENTKPEMQTPCLRCGATYRLGWNTECEAGSEPAETLPQVVTMVLDKIRSAYANGNGPENILAFEIRYLQELCDLATQYPYVDGDVDVLGPEVIVDPDGGVISWRGENYYRTAPTVNVDEALQTRHHQMLRREAMQWAVEIQKAILASGNRADRPLVDTAEAILEWLTRE